MYSSSTVAVSISNKRLVKYNIHKGPPYFQAYFLHLEIIKKLEIINIFKQPLEVTSKFKAPLIPIFISTLNHITV